MADKDDKTGVGGGAQQSAPVDLSLADEGAAMQKGKGMMLFALIAVVVVVVAGAALLLIEDSGVELRQQLRFDLGVTRDQVPGPVQCAR